MHGRTLEAIRERQALSLYRRILVMLFLAEDVAELSIAAAWDDDLIGVAAELLEQMRLFSEEVEALRDEPAK